MSITPEDAQARFAEIIARRRLTRRRDGAGPHGPAPLRRTPSGGGRMAAQSRPSRAVQEPQRQDRLDPDDPDRARASSSAARSGRSSTPSPTRSSCRGCASSGSSSTSGSGRTDRWLVSIENLAIYGILSLIFSLVIGFVLAALLDQKIRFEDTFRTIFLYPFALSFIVTGLVWQWILNPEFGVQHVGARPRLGELHLRPALQRRHRHLRHPDRRALAGHRAHHVPDARRPARHRRGHLEGRARRRHPDVEDLPLHRHPDDAAGLHHHARHHHRAASSSSTTSSSRRPAAARASPRRCRRSTSTTSCSGRRTSARASPPRR